MVKCYMFKKIIAIILILILGGGLFIWFLQNGTEDSEQECNINSDCAPASCCHPNSCVPVYQKPSCDGTFCTMECAPGTLDCNQGYCGCIKGKCEAVFNGDIS